MRISDWSSDVCSSDLEALDWDDMPQGEADLILSNPPYIPEADIDGLEPEVALHDPRGALAAGPDGLDAYRSLVRLLRRLLDPEGVAVLELGIGQSSSVARLAEVCGFRVTEIRRDLGGVERALVLKWNDTVEPRSDRKSPRLNSSQ